MEASNTKWIFMPIICLLSMLFVCNSTNSHAKEKNSKPHYSKYYKKFPAGSPEAVLTAFIEADLGDINNRDIDERYPLWWDLTEKPGLAGDDKRYLQLIIDSYRIGEKIKDSGKAAVTLNLEMDVRVFYSLGYDFNRWGGVPVKVDGIEYSTNSKQFLEEVFKEKAQKIMSNVSDDFYAVSKDKRKWVFPVRMIKKENRWVIATGYIPFQSSYVATEVASITNRMNKYIAINDVCNGKLSIQRYVREKKQLDYASTEIGTDLELFKKNYCTSNEIEATQESIKQFKQTIQELKEWTQE